jgi:hypothetical protein
MFENTEDWQNTNEPISPIHWSTTKELRDKSKEFFETLSWKEEKFEIPKPSRAIIDQDCVSTWIDWEEDVDFKKLKQKLITNLNYVDFQTFQQKLSLCIDNFNKQINGDYAVMWDYKPHSSKRWVYKLIEKELSKKPIHSNFFHPSAEKKIIKTIDKLHNQKVNTFVTIDDSAYSGEQVFNRFLKPIVQDFKLNYPNEKPEFYVIIPFITNSFKERVDEFIKENDCKINLIYAQIMPQIKDILTQEDLNLINQKRNSSIEVDADEVLYLGNTLTFFDHRVADDHSFSPEIAKVIKVKYEKPYRESESIYSNIEKEEFEKYWEPYKQSLNTKIG